MRLFTIQNIKKAVSIISIQALLFTSSQVYGAEYIGCELPAPITQKTCKRVKLEKQEILRKQKVLEELQELQEHFLKGKKIQQKVENEKFLTKEDFIIYQVATKLMEEGPDESIAQKLNSRIKDPENELDLLNEEDEIKDELELTINQNKWEVVKTGASIVGFVFFGYLLKRISRPLPGSGLKNRLLGLLWASKDKIKRSSVQLGLLFSTIMGVYSGTRWHSNNQQVETLDQMNKLLEELKKQTGRITTLKQEINELKICHGLHKDQLVDEGIAENSPKGLICL